MVRSIISMLVVAAGFIIGGGVGGTFGGLVGGTAAFAALLLVEEKLAGRRRTEGFWLRHRAAFGAASETDAVAVVVSEETGNVTVFSNRIARRADSPEELRSMLGRLFGEERGPDAST